MPGHDDKKNHGKKSGFSIPTSNGREENPMRRSVSSSSDSNQPEGSIVRELAKNFGGSSSEISSSVSQVPLANSSVRPSSLLNKPTNREQASSGERIAKILSPVPSKSLLNNRKNKTQRNNRVASADDIFEKETVDASQNFDSSMHLAALNLNSSFISSEPREQEDESVKEANVFFEKLLEKKQNDAGKIGPFEAQEKNLWDIFISENPANAIQTFFRNKYGIEHIQLTKSQEKIFITTLAFNYLSFYKQVSEQAGNRNSNAAIKGIQDPLYVYQETVNRISKKQRLASYLAELINNQKNVANLTQLNSWKLGLADFLFEVVKKTTEEQTKRVKASTSSFERSPQKKQLKAINPRLNQQEQKQLEQEYIAENLLRETTINDLRNANLDLEKTRLSSQGQIGETPDQKLMRAISFYTSNGQVQPDFYKKVMAICSDSTIIDSEELSHNTSFATSTSSVESGLKNIKDTVDKALRASQALGVQRESTFAKPTQSSLTNEFTGDIASNLPANYGRPVHVPTEEEKAQIKKAEEDKRAEREVIAQQRREATRAANNRQDLNIAPRVEAELKAARHLVFSPFIDVADSNYIYFEKYENIKLRFNPAYLNPNSKGYIVREIKYGQSFWQILHDTLELNSQELESILRKIDNGKYLKNVSVVNEEKNLYEHIKNLGEKDFSFYQKLLEQVSQQREVAINVWKKDSEGKIQRYIQYGSNFASSNSRLFSRLDLLEAEEYGMPILQPIKFYGYGNQSEEDIQRNALLEMELQQTGYITPLKQVNKKVTEIRMEEEQARVEKIKAVQENNQEDYEKLHILEQFEVLKSFIKNNMGLSLKELSKKKDSKMLIKDFFEEYQKVITHETVKEKLLKKDPELLEILKHCVSVILSLNAFSMLTNINKALLVIDGIEFSSNANVSDKERYHMRNQGLEIANHYLKNVEKLNINIQSFNQEIREEFFKRASQSGEKKQEDLEEKWKVLKKQLGYYYFSPKKEVSLWNHLVADYKNSFKQMINKVSENDSRYLAVSREMFQYLQQFLETRDFLEKTLDYTIFHSIFIEACILLRMTMTSQEQAELDEKVKARATADEKLESLVHLLSLKEYPFIYEIFEGKKINYGGGPLEDFVEYQKRQKETGESLLAESFSSDERIRALFYRVNKPHLAVSSTPIEPSLVSSVSTVASEETLVQNYIPPPPPVHLKKRRSSALEVLEAKPEEKQEVVRRQSILLAEKIQLVFQSNNLDSISETVEEIFEFQEVCENIEEIDEDQIELTEMLRKIAISGKELKELQIKPVKVDMDEKRIADLTQALLAANIRVAVILQRMKMAGKNIDMSAKEKSVNPKEQISSSSALSERRVPPPPRVSLNNSGVKSQVEELEEEALSRRRDLNNLVQSDDFSQLLAYEYANFNIRNSSNKYIELFEKIERNFPPKFSDEELQFLGENLKKYLPFYRLEIICEEIEKEDKSLTENIALLKVFSKIKFFKNAKNLDEVLARILADYASDLGLNACKEKDIEESISFFQSDNLENYELFLQRIQASESFVNHIIEEIKNQLKKIKTFSEIPNSLKEANTQKRIIPFLENYVFTKMNFDFLTEEIEFLFNSQFKEIADIFEKLYVNSLQNSTVASVEQIFSPADDQNIKETEEDIEKEKAQLAFEAYNNLFNEIEKALADEPNEILSEAINEILAIVRKKEEVVSEKIIQIYIQKNNVLSLNSKVLLENISLIDEEQTNDLASMILNKANEINEHNQKIKRHIMQERMAVEEKELQEQAEKLAREIILFDRVKETIERETEFNEALQQVAEYIDEETEPTQANALRIYINYTDELLTYPELENENFVFSEDRQVVLYQKLIDKISKAKLISNTLFQNEERIIPEAGEPPLESNGVDELTFSKNLQQRASRAGLNIRENDFGYNIFPETQSNIPLQDGSFVPVSHEEDFDYEMFGDKQGVIPVLEDDISDIESVETKEREAEEEILLSHVEEEESERGEGVLLSSEEEKEDFDYEMFGDKQGVIPVLEDDISDTESVEEEDISKENQDSNIIKVKENKKDKSTQISNPLLSEKMRHLQSIEVRRLEIPEIYFNQTAKGLTEMVIDIEEDTQQAQIVEQLSDITEEMNEDTDSEFGEEEGLTSGQIILNRLKQLSFSPTMAEKNLYQIISHGVISDIKGALKDSIHDNSMGPVLIRLTSAAMKNRSTENGLFNTLNELSLTLEKQWSPITAKLAIELKAAIKDLSLYMSMKRAHLQKTSQILDELRESMGELHPQDYYHDCEKELAQRRFEQEKLSQIWNINYFNTTKAQDMSEDELFSEHEKLIQSEDPINLSTVVRKLQLQIEMAERYKGRVYHKELIADEWVKWPIGRWESVKSSFKVETPLEEPNPIFSVEMEKILRRTPAPKGEIWVNPIYYKKPDAPQAEPPQLVAAYADQSFNGKMKIEGRFFGDKKDEAIRQIHTAEMLKIMTVAIGQTFINAKGHLPTIEKPIIITPADDQCLRQMLGALICLKINPLAIQINDKYLGQKSNYLKDAHQIALIQKDFINHLTYVDGDTKSEFSSIPADWEKIPLIQNALTKIDNIQIQHTELLKSATKEKREQAVEEAYGTMSMDLNQVEPIKNHLDVDSPVLAKAPEEDTDIEETDAEDKNLDVEESERDDKEREPPINPQYREH